MTRQRSSSVRISTIVYRFLLLIYPPAHHQTYGPLMSQLFRDLCHDAYAKSGYLGVALLWIHTLLDLAVSATAAYAEATEEVLTMLNRMVAPVSWGPVALVVFPGLLFGISRVISPLGVSAGFSFLLVALLAIGVLVLRRRLPIWGLLALGLLASGVLQWVSFLLPTALIRGLFRINLPMANALGRYLIVSTDMQQLIVAVPIWLATLWLLWKQRQSWRYATWAILLLGLAIAGASVVFDVRVLLYAGLVLLPVALGLPLSRQYGSLASLLVVGAFSSLLLFDSDYYSGYIVSAQPIYSLYVIPLVWMLVSVAPLLLLRAPTLRGRAIGLLAPALVWGTARIVVPWLFRPDFHTVSVWLGDVLLSATVLFILSLAFYLYSQSGNSSTSSKDPQVSQSGSS